MDQLQGILGESVTQEEMMAATIEGCYDMERVLDKLLNRQQEPSAGPVVVSNGATGEWLGVQGTTRRAKAQCAVEDVRMVVTDNKYVVKGTSRVGRLEGGDTIVHMPNRKVNLSYSFIPCIVTVTAMKKLYLKDRSIG